jgi:hypothetical protein
MARSMTVAGFRQMIAEMAQARMDIKAYCDYLQHKAREDKYLREEHLPILAVINYKAIPDDEQLELGEETVAWDARIGGNDLYEIVQALPENEHEIRKGVQRSVEVDGERVKIIFRGIASGGAPPFVHLEHAADHQQFPSVIVDAIESKHRKNYNDSRSLVVVFSGDYSFEDDEVIAGWVRQIRSRTSRGAFREILLVELDRLKVFPVFAPDGDNGSS